MATVGVKGLICETGDILLINLSVATAMPVVRVCLAHVLRGIHDLRTT